jgi:putative DNA primase/helicase
MSISLENLLSRLDHVRPEREGYSARCPAHDDRTSSLSVGVGEDGRLLVHCHAQCSVDDVLGKLGLTTRDLFATNGNGHAKSGMQNLASPIGHASNGKGKIAAVYDYRSESGELLYQACRFDPKGFSQRKPKTGGGWDWKTKDCRKVLFRLPELLAAPTSETVYVAEGEKDVLNLVQQGFVATCNVGGAGKWLKDYDEHLRGRRVVVLVDKDKAGRDHARQVAAALEGIAAELKVIELPGDGKDVSDWLAAGGTREQLLGLVAAADVYKSKGKAKRGRPPIVVGNPTTLDLREASGRTDVANSRRFTAAHRDGVRWCDAWGKWLVWSGRQWAQDDQRHVEALAKQVADSIWAQVGDLLPKLELIEQQELIRFARASAGAFGIGNMLSLARSEPGIPVSPAQLDSHHWRFNCINGEVDLRTGKLEPHNREHYLTKLCPHEYLLGAEAECPLWESTLDKIFGGNDELIGFFRRLLGSAMSGEIIEHILPILWGVGSNGKSIIVETIMEALGDDYAGAAPPDLLLATKGDRHPTEKADLFGKRLVVSAESDEGRRLAEGLVKQLTGGDRVKARRCREDFWSFKPSHTLLLVTNHKPIVRGRDDGIWRRLRLIPFLQRFWQASKGESGPADLEADPRLKEKLRPELPGVVSWLVKACLEWQRFGLGQPAEVTAATADYKGSMDTLGQFVADCCQLDRLATSKASDVRKRYEDWCKSNGEHPISGRRFGEYLTDRGVIRRTSNGTWYDGLALI